MTTILVAGSALSLSFLLWGSAVLPEGWAVRAGYAYAEGAFTVSYSSRPAQSDASGRDRSLVAGKTTGNWRIDLAYQFAVTHDATTAANTYGYNGKYNISQHLLGLTVAYKF